MNKQGHDNRPESAGQREPEVDLAALFPQGQLQLRTFIVPF